MPFRVFIVSLLIFLFALIPVRVFSETASVTANAYAVVEASTGRLLAEKNGDVQMYPASTTKIMTATLALEHGSLTQMVMVSPRAAGVEDTNLRAGDVLTVDNLLRLMLWRSDNGAAMAIAEHTAGSVEDFATQMNQKAKDLGMKHTHFTNPSGLPDPNHYTCAEDLAKLARYAMQRADFREYVATQKGEVHWLQPQNRGGTFENSNELLKTYAGADGVKTGYTHAAGGCLVASARRDGMELIAVVLHANGADNGEKERFTDAAKLLDAGFQNTKLVALGKLQAEPQRIWVRGGEAGRVNVAPEEDVRHVPLQTGETLTDCETRYDLPRITTAPITKGTRIGDWILLVKGKEILRVPIVATEDVPQGWSLLGMIASFFDGRL